MSKLRTFEIEFAIDMAEKVNQLMRSFDVFQGPSTGIVTSATITTENTLPFGDYMKLIAKAFEENDGKLYHIREITK